MEEAFKKFNITDKLSSFIPGKHKFLDLLPEPLRSKAIILGYKLGLINAFGYVKIQGYDPTGTIPIGPEKITCNIITDAGAGVIRDLLAGSFAGAGINKQLYMDFGIGTTTPTAADTDLTTQPGGAAHPKIIATVTSPGSYEVRCEAFIDSSWGDTRPIVIAEFGLFDNSADSTGNMIAHALVSPTHNLTGSNTAKGTYGILIRWQP